MGGSNHKKSERKELFLPMANQEQQAMLLPIDRKMLLSIREAAEYSNIGINKIDELLKQPTGKAMVATAKMLVAMSRGAEDQKHYENPGYTPSPLTFEAIRSLNTPDYIGIHQSFAAIMGQSMKGHTVEVEPSKKKENTEEK